MTVAYMVGVKDDGGALGPLVPANPRRALRAYQGSGLLVRMAVVTPNGVAVDLTGSTNHLTIKKRTMDDETVIGATGTILTAVGEGRVDFLVTGVSTRERDPGRYVFDVWHLDSLGDAWVLVPTSPFLIEPHVGSFADSDVNISPGLEITAGAILVEALDENVLAGVRGYGD